jgi:hypothetical protein
MLIAEKLLTIEPTNEDKRMYKYLLVLCLTVNVSYAAASKQLVDVLVNKSEFTKLLAKFGISGKDAVEFQKGVSTSIAALGNKDIVTKQQLKEAIAELSIKKDPADATMRKALQVLLDSDVEKVQKADVVNAVNNLVALADRYGKSVMFTCSKCVSTTEAQHGLKLSVTEVTNSSAKKLLANEIPNDPTLLNKYISSQMTKLKMGKYGSNVTPQTVSPDETKVLAIFLGLADKGSPDQKALAAAIKDLNPQLIDPKNPQKFWKLMAQDMSDSDLRNWKDMLTEIKARAVKDNVSTEEAWNRTLKDKAQGDASLTKIYEDLKAKKCFFI